MSRRVPPVDHMKKSVLFLRTDACVFDPRIQKEATSLRRNGYAVRVFGWDRKAEYPRSETIHDVQYSRTRIPAPYGSKLLAFLLPLFWIRALGEILRIRPEIVHACDMDALIPALVAKTVMPVKVVYDIFDSFADKVSGLSDGIRSLIRKCDYALMRFPEAVIVTDERRKGLIAHVRVRSLHVIMNVPPSPDIAVASEPRPPLLRVCYAGVIHEHRGLYLIAEAIRGLEGVETLFAGWIPRPVDREFLGQQREIRFLGKVPYEESLRLLSASDAILALYDPGIPINLMASSNKIYEAMSASRPVITNAETAMAAIIQEEDCGCLVPYGDAAALRATIVRLRDDRSFGDRLGRNGHAAFKSKYNWESMEKRLLGLYATLE